MSIRSISKLIDDFDDGDSFCMGGFQRDRDQDRRRDMDKMSRERDNDQVRHRDLDKMSRERGRDQDRHRDVDRG